MTDFYQDLVGNSMEESKLILTILIPSTLGLIAICSVLMIGHALFKLEKVL